MQQEKKKPGGNHESKNQELNRLNQEKNEFLGIVAHDLKNPLSGIKGLSEYIQELVFSQGSNVG